MRYRCIWCRRHFQETETEDQRLANAAFRSKVFDLSDSRSAAEMEGLIGRMLVCPHCQAPGGYIRIPSKSPGHKVYWSKKEKDLIYWTDGTVQMDDGTELTASRATSKLLHYAFDVVDVFDGKSLTQELEERGYDMTTLKFEIRKKIPFAGRLRRRRSDGGG